MTFRPEQQNDSSHKERAELKDRQQEILRRIRKGKLLSIPKDDFDCLEPRDRINLYREGVKTK